MMRVSNAQLHFVNEIYSDYIKEALNTNEPIRIISPNKYERVVMQQVVRNEIQSLSYQDLLEIKISFTNEDPIIVLKEKLEVNAKKSLSELKDFFSKSLIIKKAVKEEREILISLNNIEALPIKHLYWIMRNCYNLTMHNSKELRNNRITLVFEGAIPPDKLKLGDNSPFPLSFKYPRAISKKKYDNYLLSLFKNKRITDSARRSLWSYTQGDIYYTEKLSEIINEVRPDFISSDLILDTLNEYTKRGAFNDDLKWWALVAFNEINTNFDRSFENIRRRVEESWNNQSIDFKQLCFSQGIVTTEPELKLRCPALFRAIYDNAIKRVENLENIVLTQINPSFIIEDYLSDYHSCISKLKERVYYGFADNIILGAVRRINLQEIEIIGNYNFSDRIKINYQNSKDLLNYDEGYIVLYDDSPKSNDNQRIIKIFPSPND